MNNRERVKAIFNYQKYDRMPVVHFGYWDELLEKWKNEGHLTKEEISGLSDGNEIDKNIAKKLGFDFNWFTVVSEKIFMNSLSPIFHSEILEEYSDGTYKTFNEDGVIIIKKKGVVSIPKEIDHTLKDRSSWEKHYLPKLQFSADRVNIEDIKQKRIIEKENPLGLYCGSLFGQIRNWLGVEGISYLYSDDEGLYDEIINTVGELSYKVIEKILSSNVEFDFAHFWEDICFANGPLVSPNVFNEKVGPHYKKICNLLNQNGINLISLDCDGQIDSLIPTWLDNGVNTMFPIEVGTWEASIEPWRKKYGKKIMGVGGMNKNIFGRDYKAIDDEVERLKRLIDLGGYIPCPDHRIPPDAKWENVQYYCDKIRNLKVNS